MPTTRPPVKTTLGLDELRSRTHGLNQRHRTMLLLVDGQRPLSEVLTMGLQAGARTTHFEDLLRLGMVEMEIDGEVPDSRSPSSDPPDSGGSGSSVSGVLAVELDAPAATAEGRAEPATKTMLTTTTTLRASSTASGPALESGGGQRALDRAETDALHLEVRELLTATVRIDAPLFAALTLVRVRRAKTTKELINLVWEIERHLVASPKSHTEMQTLYRARELLGMGNTQVSTDDAPEFSEARRADAG